MRLRPGAEHARRPTRPTAPPTSTARSSRSASAIAGRSSTTTAAITAASADDVRRFCADADLFINLSGGSWFWRDEYARIPRKVFIDSDPAFTQLAIAKARAVVRRVLPALRSPVHVRREHRHAGVADSDRRLHLAQDLAAGHARRLGAPTRAPRDRFTTVMTWQIESFTDVGGNKDQEFVQVHRPAVADAAAASSWRSTARSSCCASTAGRRWTRWACRARLWDYRDFIQRSKAEFGVAKHTYVATRSGWFSDRTECYLAAGPAGAGAGHRAGPAHLPHGDGPAGFSTPDEALAGIDRINARLRRARAARARDRARALRRRARPAAAPRRRRAHERPLRIAHVAPVATTIPPPQVRLGRDDDVAADRRTRRARPRRHAVRHRRLDDAAPSCTPSIRTATGTTRTCGRGSCTRC